VPYLNTSAVVIHYEEAVCDNALEKFAVKIADLDRSKLHKIAHV